MIFYKKWWMSIKKRIYLLIGIDFHVKKIKGQKFLLDMRNQVDRTVDAFSVYEKEQIAFFISRLKKSKCNGFIDIGAHWGYYSFVFANEASFDQAEIHAIEPDKINRYQLYANIFLNKLQDRINVYEQAISSKEGELKFHHHDDGKGHNRGRSCITEDGENIVKTSSLDSLIDLKGKVLGIKIDVEGHEIEAISGMHNILKNNVCILQIESFPDSFEELNNCMIKLGYKKIHTIVADHYYSNE